MLNDEEEHRQLIDLIEKMLEYDPDKRCVFTNIVDFLCTSRNNLYFFYLRITLAKALEHEFFNLIPNNMRHEDDPIKTET